MPELENDIEEMNDDKAVVSDMSKPDEADGAKAPEQSAEAQSSSAADVSKPAEPKDTLSIVRDVVDPNKAAAASSAKESPEGGNAAGQLPKDNENFSDVPFNKHPRFQEVLGKLKTAETDATRYRNVENFISEQGLGAEEAADLLRIGGLIKTNPVEAWKQMRPVVERVLIAAGEILPADLKDRVQRNELSPEAAAEISRARASQQSMQVRQQFDQQQGQARQQREMADAVQGAVASWESDRRTRDPNFEAKMPLLQKEVAWLQMKEGRPNNPMGVQAQLQKAYDAVNASYRPPAATRQKPAVAPIPNGQAAANAAPAKPKSTMDIIQQELAKRSA